MKSKRKDYITLMSVISAFSVVLLHSNGCFWIFSKSRYWFISNIIDALFFFAVPLFSMITGITLIGYRDKYSTKEYLKKRFNKTVIPYLFFSVFGIIYLLLNNVISLDSINFKYIFNGLFSDPPMSLYWFFRELFKVYLCIPLFASVNKNKRKVEFSYLVLVGVILNYLIPFIINVFKIDVSFGINVPVSSGFLIYVLIGYLLDNYKIDKKKKIVIHILGIIGLLMHIIGTYVLSMEANEIVRTFKGYTNIPCLLYSISIFIIIKDLSIYIKNYDIINRLSKYTFSIYLIHIYVMDIIKNLFNLDYTRLSYIFIMPFFVIPLCILITYILRKIPILRKIVP